MNVVRKPPVRPFDVCVWFPFCLLSLFFVLVMVLLGVWMRSSTLTYTHCRVFSELMIDRKP